MASPNWPMLKAPRVLFHLRNFLGTRSFAVSEYGFLRLLGMCRNSQGTRADGHACAGNARKMYARKMYAGGTLLPCLLCVRFYLGGGRLRPRRQGRSGIYRADRFEGRSRPTRANRTGGAARADRAAR